jgi:hypothetical protein
MIFLPKRLHAGVIGGGRARVFRSNRNGRRVKWFLFFKSSRNTCGYYDVLERLNYLGNVYVLVSIESMILMLMLILIQKSGSLQAKGRIKEPRVVGLDCSSCATWVQLLKKIRGPYRYVSKLSHTHHPLPNQRSLCD